MWISPNYAGAVMLTLLFVCPCMAVFTEESEVRSPVVSAIGVTVMNGEMFACAACLASKQLGEQPFLQGPFAVGAQSVEWWVVGVPAAGKYSTHKLSATLSRATGSLIARLTREDVAAVLAFSALNSLELRAQNGVATSLRTGIPDPFWLEQLATEEASLGHA